MAKIWQEGQKRETEEERRARIQHNEIQLNLPYKLKVRHAEERVRDWKETCESFGKNYAVSVGGLDSITLLMFVRKVLKEDVQGISVSILEDKSIQKIHKELGVVPIKPLKSKTQVIKEFGFPVISKNTSARLARLQVPNDESPIIKAYMTGEEGAWGGTRPICGLNFQTSGSRSSAGCTRTSDLTLTARSRRSRFPTNAVFG